MEKIFPKWRPVLRFKLIGLALVLTLVTFGESELTDRFAGKILAAIPDIVRNLPAPEEKVLVVRVGGANAQADRNAEQEWPLAYGDFRAFIERSWCYGAQGVFIDIGLAHTRGVPSGDIEPPLQELADEIAVIGGDKRTAAERAELWSTVCRTEERNERMALSRVDHATAAIKPMSIHFARPVSEGAWKALRKYITSTKMPGGLVDGRNSDSTGLLPAAYAVADSNCDGGDVTACAAHREGYDDRFLAKDSVYTPAEQRSLDAALKSVQRSCVYRDDGFWSRSLRVMERYSIVSLRQTDVMSDLDCPPLVTVDSNVYMDRAFKAVVAAHTRGKVVVLGAALPMLGDTYSTVAHMQLQGFYQVAESIDQLLTTRYRFTVPWGSFLARLAFLFFWIYLLQVARAWQIVHLPMRRSAADIVVQFTLVALGVALLWATARLLRIDGQVVIRDAAFVILTCGIVVDPSVLLFKLLDWLRKRTNASLAEAG